jgi:hypothetical protein
MPQIDHLQWAAVMWMRNRDICYLQLDFEGSNSHPMAKSCEMNDKLFDLPPTSAFSEGQRLNIEFLRIVHHLFC